MRALKKSENVEMSKKYFTQGRETLDLIMTAFWLMNLVIGSLTRI